MPKSTLPSLCAWEPVPPFALTAVGSKREFSDATLVGRTSLLIFHDQHAQDEVQSLQERVRLQRPDHTDVFIASVVNMSVVPVFLRQIALGVMEKGYTGAKEHMPAGIDAADYVVILTDWDGRAAGGRRSGAGRRANPRLKRHCQRESRRHMFLHLHQSGSHRAGAPWMRSVWRRCANRPWPCAAMLRWCSRHSTAASIAGATGQMGWMSCGGSKQHGIRPKS